MDDCAIELQYVYSIHEPEKPAWHYDSYKGDLNAVGMLMCI